MKSRIIGLTANGYSETAPEKGLRLEVYVSYTSARFMESPTTNSEHLTPKLRYLIISTRQLAKLDILEFATLPRALQKDHRERK